jgi:hypothetical protein
MLLSDVCCTLPLPTRIRSTPPTTIQSALAEFSIGSRVAKSFEVNRKQKWFAGHVVGYDNIKKWSRIKYTEGDTEEIRAQS